MLLGSNFLPSHITIGTYRYQLGDVVRRAFADSGLTLDDWNALSERDRDIRLMHACYDIRDGK